MKTPTVTTHRGVGSAAQPGERHEEEDRDDTDHERERYGGGCLEPPPKLL